MPTRPIGSVVGAAGGLAFVLLNAGRLPAGGPLRAAAVLAFLTIVWFVVLRGPRVDREPPSRRAVRTYGFCVVAMVVAILVGARLLVDVLGRPHAVLVWVVLVLGAHFWPFARAFDLPVFRWLALALVVVALVGAVPVLASGSATAAAATGVAAGAVLLVFSALGPRLSR